LETANTKELLVSQNHLETFLGCPLETYSKNLQYSFLTPIHQQEDWDCGVACLLMMLRWLLQPTKVLLPSGRLSPEEDVLRTAILNQIASPSIWTADLVWQLHRLLTNNDDDCCYHDYGVPKLSARFLFCSQTMQVVTEHSSMDYYEENFDQDHIRVTRLFDQLQDETPSALHSLPKLFFSWVLAAVQNPNCIAMVLVDNSLLCKEVSRAYAGHYVLLCGTSCEEEHIERSGTEESYCLMLCNPGRGASMVCPVLFEKAWRAQGTDEDILFLVREREKIMEGT